MHKLIITPRTKIYDLLEAYPELEEILIRLAPEFQKLKNPVLRKTIARVASIAQAAVVGRLNVDELVNQLRNRVGQGGMEQSLATNPTYVTTCPEWFSRDSIVESINISEMLNRGEQPVHEVLTSLRKLNRGQILEILAPFLPAPLVDKSLSLGYTHWVEQAGEASFRIYFSTQEGC